MPSDPNPIIEFDQVHFSYPGNPILNDVSFQIYPGEFIGIIGPNGGGKTTLLKLILGFLKPNRGNIRFFYDPTKSYMAYVPQSIRFDRDFPISVEEVVLSGLISHLPWYGKFRAGDRKIAKEMLELMKLTHLADHPFGSLSGGQAQRILIARALISQPQILLLDEPTASVDNQSEIDIYTLLNQLKKQLTIVMVTHDLRAAIDQVERVFCVQGSITSLTPEDVCKHFAIGLYHMPLKQKN